MKLSVETCMLYRKFGDFEGTRLIKEAGFDGIDYSYYWLPSDGEVLGDGYVEYAKKLRAHLDQLGLECKQAHAPFAIHYGEEFSTETVNYRDIVRSLESAAILGVENIVVHAISVPIELKHTLEEYNYRFYKSLEPYCEKFGIHIAVENLFTKDAKRDRYYSRLCDPQVQCDFIRSLNSPWFTACVDVGHAAILDWEPEEYLAAMDPALLKCVHIQDGNYITDTHTLPYLGKFNWAAIVAALKKLGYEGEMNFEIIRFLENFPDALMPEALRLAERTGRYLISL